MKRIALLADLHGNLPALEAVENDLKARVVDEIWCLGDLIGKGPSSAETFDWAVRHCSVILRGNWEEGVGTRRFAQNDGYYYRQLGENRMRALLEFPLEHRCLLSGKRLRLLHGRPVMPVLQDVCEEEEALDWLFQPDFDIVGYADIHRAALRALHGGRLLFSAGSVGNSLRLPMAQYTLLEGEPGAQDAPLQIGFQYVPYDAERAARDARSSPELPRGDAYVREILTGVYSRAPQK